MKTFFSAIMLALAATPALAGEMFHCNAPRSNENNKIDNQEVCETRGIGKWLPHVCSTKDQNSLLP
jgi:hypothetical protein